MALEHLRYTVRVFPSSYETRCKYKIDGIRCNNVAISSNKSCCEEHRCRGITKSGERCRQRVSSKSFDKLCCGHHMCKHKDENGRCTNIGNIKLHNKLLCEHHYHEGRDLEIKKLIVKVKRMNISFPKLKKSTAKTRFLISSSIISPKVK